MSRFRLQSVSLAAGLHFLASSGIDENADGRLDNCGCAVDFNQSGAVTVQDLFDYLAAYTNGDPRADFNGVGGLTVQDVFDFLGALFIGCPG